MEKVNHPVNNKRPVVYRTKVLNRARFSAGTFEIELSRPADFSFVPGQRIRFAHESMEKDYIENHLPPLVYDFYLCGRSDMIRDVILIVDEKFPGSYVYTEIYY